MNQRRVRGAQSVPQTGARLPKWGSFGLRHARLRHHFRPCKMTYHDLTVKMGESGRVRLKWPGIAGLQASYGSFQVRMACHPVLVPGLTEKLEQLINTNRSQRIVAGFARFPGGFFTPAARKSKPPRISGGRSGAACGGRSRRSPTFAPKHYHGPGGLNGRVRNGNGCDPAGMVAGKPAGGLSGRAGRDSAVVGHRHKVFTPHQK